MRRMTRDDSNGRGRWRETCFDWHYIHDRMPARGKEVTSPNVSRTKSDVV
jgi:hypothetical protein